MKEGALVGTNLTRRQFHKLLSILEEDRNDRAKDVEYYKEKGDDYKDKFSEALNAVRDIDMLLEALYEED